MNRSILSPIVLFTYNRPLHTQQLLNSLAKNTEAKDSIIYIYCDGAKENASKEDILKINEVRSIISAENRFKKVFVKIQNKNNGLANSIINGVTEIVNKHEKIIVLEDDLILSPFFLSYMNDSLDRYKDNEKVGQIGACNFFACGKNYPDYFFLAMSECLGWGTWKEKWNAFNPDGELLLNLINEKNLVERFNAYGSYDMVGMLQAQIDGKVSSWAIRWQAVCVLNNWLTLYPNPSYTQHKESQEATHASVDIIPPLVNKKLKYYTKEVVEVDCVIEAMKLGYSGKGDYFGKLKWKFKKERIKKNIKIYFHPVIIKIFKSVKNSCRY